MDPDESNLDPYLDDSDDEITNEKLNERTPQMLNEAVQQMFDMTDSDDEDSDQEEQENAIARSEELKILTEITNQIQAIADENKRFDEKQETLNQRESTLNEHFKNVTEEAGREQMRVSSLDAEDAQLDSHLAVLDRNYQRYNEERKRLSQQDETLTERQNSIKNSIFSRNEKLDEIKASLEVNQQQLEDWVNAQRQKEEDLAVMEKYKKSDESKLKAAMDELEKNNSTLVELKTTLENEATNSKSKSMEFDKTMQAFVEDHDERQNCLTRWQNTLEQVHKRDDEIRRYGEQYAVDTERIHNTEDQLRDQTIRYEQQEKDNREAEVRIEAFGRDLAAKRDALQQRNEFISDQKDEVALIQGRLVKLTSDYQALESQKRNLERMRDTTIAQVNQVEAKLKRSQKELEEIQMFKGKSEDILAKADERLSAARQELQIMEKREEASREDNFKQATKLQELRSQEAILIAEISGGQARIRQIDNEIRKREDMMAKQDERLYTVEYEKQILERKVSRASGERSDEEKRELEKQISFLEADLDAVLSEKKVLKDQVKHLDDDFKKNQRELSQLEKKELALKELNSECRLKDSGLMTDAMKLSKEIGDLQVMRDSMKVKLQQMAEDLQAQENKTFSLANRMNQLRLSMEERRAKIDSLQNEQTLRLKITQEEAHQNAMEKASRQKTINNLNAKLDGLMKSCPYPRVDENGEKLTEAAILMKIGREREDIRRKGSKLQKKIKRVEKLNNVIRSQTDVLFGNEKARDELDKPADKSSKSFKKLEYHNKRLDDLRHETFMTRQSAEQTARELEEERQKLDVEMEKLESFNNRRVEFEEAVAEQDAELQGVKDLATKQYSRIQALSKAHREEFGDINAETPDEMAIRVHALKESNRNVLGHLGNFGALNPQCELHVRQLLKEQGLRIPTTTTTTS
eukprot:TRINITY_DN10165_c0_g2_i2.p1 TRINITY_DN10165_c0_g2~~TRINITY_DN10165_c0_g2_i2.p1  ORF type:complete len:924 (+),score=392.65 TRINITY_DN10165_c0_g2_i2:179-2950(+)